MQLWILPGYAGEQRTESMAEKNHDLGGIMKRREWVSLIILALAAVVMYQLVLRVEKILNRTWGVQS